MLGGLRPFEILRYRLATAFNDLFDTTLDLHLQNIVPLHRMGDTATKWFLDSSTLWSTLISDRNQ